MRILICEDSVLLREGIARLLTDAGHEVVAQLPDATALEAAIRACDPDLAILDVRMPPTRTNEGILAAIGIRGRGDRPRVLVLSQYVEERYAADLIASGPAGFGYLLKDRVADVRDFLAAIEQVASGGTVLDPEVVTQLLARRRRDARMERLTPRERQVLALMAEGAANQAIADRLYISAGSVEKHISAVFQKLELDPEDGNRRVLAVLAHLDAPGSDPSRPHDAPGGIR
ncbi:response regulator transcription factor [Agrococcus sp. Marseille-Q4369]|uniref:LuxR C-terminal-related transcriptional regulator n=1 Tax=Agrococcus sp. Marseille-Q4369 TaxID=2810513 RepID=UPI001B8BB885|nr:response regulator transcription factor [Agrococcus sp. Marseille-Q4369]QUW19395.1 response regulator transcription factor [Agrococcus sp. Marseille-Q4369]